MKRKAADTSFDVAAFELLEAAEATAAAPVIDDNHTTQLGEHADLSPPAVAAPASGGAAAVDDVARTTPNNEEADGEEERENIRRGAARMDADQDAKNNPHKENKWLKRLHEAWPIFNQPPDAFVIELSVGRACAIMEESEDGGLDKIKRDDSGRERFLWQDLVERRNYTPRQFADALDRHRTARFKHKGGPFYTGGVFFSERRRMDQLEAVNLVTLDLDNIDHLTRASLQALLETFGVGFIYYSTFSQSRSKPGLCARVIFWLSSPITSPTQDTRKTDIKKQLGCIVDHICKLLGINSNPESRSPNQYMWTPRLHVAGLKGLDEWWCELHDGPTLNPDSLPGGVSLADLLPPSAPQLTDTNEPSATPTPPHPPATSSKATPQIRKGSDDQLHARGLAYIQKCADDLKTFGSGRYERITQHVGPRCGSIAAGHGLTEAEGLKPLEEIVSGWGRLDLTKALRATFAHGYQDPRTLSDTSKSSKKTASPDADANTSSAAPSTANDAQPDTTPPHAEAASIAPRRSPPFAKGNPELGTCLALRRLFNSLLRQDPPDQRPHLVCIDSVEDIDAIAAKIPDGKRVIIGIPPTHSLYPYAINTFLTKNCDVRRV